MKLYFKDIEKIKGERIANFIERILHSKYPVPNTYFDKECTELQCDNRNRSIDELLLIIKTYYPKTSEDKIYSEFRYFLEKRNKKEYMFLFCKEAKKWIFHSKLDAVIQCNSKPTHKYIQNYSDSTNKRDEKGIGVETYNSFMKKLGYSLYELEI